MWTQPLQRLKEKFIKKKVIMKKINCTSKCAAFCNSANNTCKQQIKIAYKLCKNKGQAQHTRAKKKRRK